MPSDRANAIKAKRREDDDLSAVESAVISFNLNAPEGAYHLDRIADRLREGRPQIDPCQVRVGMFRACASALRLKHHVEVVHPLHEQTTRIFLSALSKIREAERELQTVHIDHLGTVLHRMPTTFDSEDTLEAMVRRIDNDARHIVSSASKLRRTIDEFLDIAQLPDFQDCGPRTVLFTRYLIDLAQEFWFEAVGFRVDRNDVTTFQSMVFAALKDFKYPIPNSEAQFQVQLTDRIRKQIFGN